MKKKTNVPRPKFQNTRKALRKEKRIQKKKRRQEHSIKKKNEINSPGKFVRPSDYSDPKPPVKKKKIVNQSSAQEILMRQSNKVKKEANKLQSQMDKQRRKMFLKANEDEDKIIKKLEKQLGLNKTKNKNNFFADDGLDYLLEICDRATSEQIVAAEKHLADVEKDSDFEEDLAMVTGKEKLKKDKKESKSKQAPSEYESENDDIDDDDESADDEDLEGSDNEETGDLDDSCDEYSGSDDDLDDMDEEEDEPSDEDEKPTKISKKDKKATEPIIKKGGKEKIISQDDISKVFSEDEISHLSGLDGFSDDGDEPVEKQEAEKPNVWEDIYGRKRDKEGNIIKEEKGVYIPPHLRNKDSASDKDLLQLKRQIKSVLNKLAGTNLHWACTSIENLYASNSRNSVNTALTALWVEATIGGSVTPDRLVTEHAALVSVLHANVGSEIGAHFLEHLCRKFDEMMQSRQPMEDKRLDNLVACLAYLYSFKIYHPLLLYDILGRLVQELTEKNIDCVLTVLRAVGGVLRKEEPAALKTFVQDTQAKVAALSETASAGSRIKFLMEVLLAVKNNNLTKIPGYDPMYAEELRKSAKAVLRRGNYVTPLNIRLEDLLKAHERGKWWVVGSAWEGNRTIEVKPTVKLPAVDQKLLELARTMRMNTDVRRSIFCAIMSAEDYMDAFEKLEHLGLRAQQQREIAHVLLACCLRERTHNPYYAVLAARLCAHRPHQLAFQFSVWDKIKDLENIPTQGRANLAQFLTHLFMEKCLPLSILKIIQFSDLNKTTVKFMRQILLAIIMNADLQASLEVFHRISKPPKLHMFRESLRLFIQHFLIKNAGKKNNVLTEKEMVTLKDRAVEVDKILTMHENKLRL
ncbi:nucleolar MIF4G domain-containing protein 1 isoform X2 [Aricia agestis]|uniref:nucleolar MIF4G domain-containing protein 1 isoform X2 n=1 Tax=Aricia agestis TaxID=91739 RepID=UPI001C20A11C|nr:nucleolar MIF4G domain-containing protein 1 isoform X2 [Aricia agestis]